MLALSVIALLGAAAAPTLRARALDAHIDRVAAEVEAVRAQAAEALESTGDWPADVSRPPPSAPDDSTPTFLWRRMTSVVPGDSVTPPTYYRHGTVSVVGADDAVLGDLLARYPDSFVHGPNWTLVLERVRVERP